MPKKSNFGGVAEIYSQLCGRGIQKLAGWETWSHFIPLFKNFKFESKTKSYANLKLAYS